MLREKCFEKEWIDQQTQRLGARDPQLVETCIYALELVGRLAEAGLDFVFNGGTSLLLHIQPLHRLSIDVDITTPVEMPELERVLATVCQKPFGSYQYPDNRDRENPPTRYFQIPYESPTQGRTWSLQLDVLLSDVTYPVIESKPITLDLIETDKVQTVNVPSIECLLGDKLTAFAPETIGVLYDPLPRTPGDRRPEPRPIRVLKQLFDVSELFSIANDLRIVSDTYNRLFDVQNVARGGKFSREQTLDDTVDAAYWISQLDLRKQETNEKTNFLRAGIKALDSHILGPTFNIQAARIAAARAALLAALLRKGRLDSPLADLRVIPEASELAELIIDGRFGQLNRLRKISIEAFYYWFLVDQYLA